MSDRPPAHNDSNKFVTAGRVLFDVAVDFRPQWPDRCGSAGIGATARVGGEALKWRCVTRARLAFNLFRARSSEFPNHCLRFDDASREI